MHQNVNNGCLHRIFYSVLCAFQNILNYPQRTCITFKIEKIFTIKETGVSGTMGRSKSNMKVKFPKHKLHENKH